MLVRYGHMDAGPEDLLKLLMKLQQYTQNAFLVLGQPRHTLSKNTKRYPGVLLKFREQLQTILVSGVLMTAADTNTTMCRLVASNTPTLLTCGVPPCKVNLLLSPVLGVAALRF